MKAVLCILKYIIAVNYAAFPEAALVLLVFGQAYLATDLRGLEINIRTTLMHQRSLLIMRGSTACMSSGKQCPAG